MPTRMNYITGRTSEFNELREGVPVHLEVGGFVICTSGESGVVINSRQYSIKAWDLMVAFPHSFAHAFSPSDDFDGVIFGVDIDTLINTEISNRSFYITTIRNNPCISLQREEAEKILTLIDRFLDESAKSDHPLRTEINEAILKIIIYEIAALFHHSTPKVEMEGSRDDVIFNNFIVQLHSQEPLDRSLEHFAHKQMITPSHLSKVVKRVSSRAASAWISSYTIVSIKRLLQNKELPISSIAEKLNFPNASFLSQYFKKHTSQSPKEYRAEFFNGD
ncbi:MAG: helix-turn-helix domain-containing protein [Rikenellaceae bacterium]